jgi:hypothetical protein
MERVIKRRLRHRSPGISIDADLNAVVAINQGKSGQVNEVRSTSSNTVVQTSRREGRRKADA